MAENNRYNDVVQHVRAVENNANSLLQNVEQLRHDLDRLVVLENRKMEQIQVSK